MCSGAHSTKHILYICLFVKTWIKSIVGIIYIIDAYSIRFPLDLFYKFLEKLTREYLSQCNILQNRYCTICTLSIKDRCI